MCRSCEAQSACLEFALSDQPGLGRLGRHLRGGAPQAAPGLGLPASATPPDLTVTPRRPSPASQQRHPDLGHGPPPRRVDRAGARIVPSSSERTSVRTIDRPRPGGLVGSKPTGAPRRRRPRRRRARRPSRRRPSTTVPPPPPAGKAWSAAFWSSSLSTTASGVATAAGTTPGSPSTMQRIGRSGTAKASSAMRVRSRDDVEEGHVLARLAGEDLVHQGDRPHPADRLLDGGLGLGRLEPAALQAQQRRDRLEVVLHPVVDLPDGGVLGQQQPVAPAQLGDVSQQDDGAGDLARRSTQRDAAQGDGDLGPALELAVTGSGPSKAPRIGVSSRPSSPRRMPSALAWMPMPVQRRDAVGGRVLHPHLAVEDDHAVADAGQGVGVGVLLLEGELGRRRSSGRTG